MVRGDFEVLWTRTAEEDLKGIVAWIAADSIDEALRVLERIRARATALASLPERGRVVPELKEQGVSLYREVVVEPWRMLYRVVDHRVYVLGVFDSRRNLEDLLLDRLLRE